MLGFQVGHEGFKGTGAPGVAKAGDHAGHVSAPGGGAQGANHMRAHKPGSGPCAKADKVGALFDGVQAVVADLKAQQPQVGAYGGQPQ